MPHGDVSEDGEINSKPANFSRSDCAISCRAMETTCDAVLIKRAEAHRHHYPGPSICTCGNGTDGGMGRERPERFR